MQKLYLIMIFLYIKASLEENFIDLPELSLSEKLILNKVNYKMICFKINKEILKPNSIYLIFIHYKGGVLFFFFIFYDLKIYFRLVRIWNLIS